MYLYIYIFIYLYIGTAPSQRFPKASRTISGVLEVLAISVEAHWNDGSASRDVLCSTVILQRGTASNCYAALEDGSSRLSMESIRSMCAGGVKVVFLTERPDAVKYIRRMM